MQQLQTPSVLTKIINTKHQELAQAKKTHSFYDLEQIAHSKKTDLRNFANALRTQKRVNIIAEVKKASPSKGIICQNFDPVAIAQGYETAGASCLSVLTDVQYFQGADDDLVQARQAVSLPVLRKDFMLNPYQIMQSRALGADAILLIMACLSHSQAEELQALALELGMTVLVECHNHAEVERALKLTTHERTIYGINNRNLKNFETDLNTTVQLRTLFDSSQLLVTESGIRSANDVKFMLQHNINTFLIGEQFMKTDSPKQALSTLLTSI
ncbi:indole-3-glycerol-phosphate synthase [Moraxella macacae 0408225]|uniref:Indole-3-glycerol phosphate synthase n=1 Tax=Moraxella macacae 0408225 TaxID=1230338 RepID=L2F716_9GAMM|nr:indole-3-glycerol phosphate synthase TrpC [Moraxella macacae]ELA08690.1 indole-3-glycerol-phosphate synthase [Moraxella macacae 0408225]